MNNAVLKTRLASPIELVSDVYNKQCEQEVSFASPQEYKEVISEHSRFTW